MKKHDTIATRLSIILNKFNSGERFSVDDLVDEFGVTKRTVQRDLNERLSYL
jgi:predicted DNA-binding transcriptional regulator YafY